MAYPSYPAYPAYSPPERSTNPWVVVAAASIGVWAVLVTVLGQAVGWLADQVLLVTGLETPVWTWPVVAIVNAVLAGTPAVILAFVPRSPAVRAAGRVWLLGAAALGGLGLLRAVPEPLNELYLAFLALAAAGGAVLLRGRPSLPALGFAGGLAVLLPWLWIGALGGLTETVLAVLAAAAVGWLAAAILDAGFWERYGIALGGFIAGVALLLLAAGVGQAGAQLAAMLVLPPLGFAAAALRSAGPLVAVAALGPLAFVDPEEVTLLLSTGRDVPVWAAIAAAISLAVAVLVGIGYPLARARRTGRLVGAVAVVLMVVTGGVIYLGPGQPGLYGERLFVILKSQADLSGVSTASRDARVTGVYDRLVDHAESSQADLRRTLDRWHLDYTPYYLVNAIEVDGGPAIRAWLSRRDDVDRVLLNQRLRPLPAQPGVTHGDLPAPTAPPWNISMIGADRAATQLGVDGSGVVVGTSDSGVDGAHPALSGNFRGGDDSWYDPWNHTRTPTDRGGHGTHTLGSAVGRTVGVAPGAQWVGCVNLDRNLGNPAHYLDCMQFMLAPFPSGADPFTDGRPERAPHVLTNSWGCPRIEGCDEGALRAATAAFAAAGIFFAVAAGNTGPFCGSIDDPPAPYADVETVGAVDRRRQVTQFSSRGPTQTDLTKPDIVAPGEDVLSAMPGGGYAALSGTSMATPQVAGVVALMWSANPRLIGDLARTRAILRDTASPATPGESTGECAAVDVTGAGLVDGYAAVQAARAAS
ncbi:S8 family serine peptidase [Phytohabitans suffuscus]|uniref:Peptidase S8 n=1 Tax=Phytohabitans suffuscus TaxID=624315 RepID=A0A6F8YHF5_9ACTN|nr:S8 family serine peptidase [Phytohabitans suffuscus]BCB85532.1 peptidase S8 [Phytohabitans suffuscus]